MTEKHYKKYHQIRTSIFIGVNTYLVTNINEDENSD